MTKRPEFLRKGFQITRPQFCDKCRKIEKHEIQLICDCPKDEAVHALIVCHVCLEAHEKLSKLGLVSTNPTHYQRYFVQSYTWLVLHEHGLDP